MLDFQIARTDLHRCRSIDVEPRRLEDGQARLTVERFGLTSNNITYAKFGDAMSYWNFFPAEDGWGHMPVWGFATVGESAADGLEVGTRVYGYLPPAGELIVSPRRVGPRGFEDGAAHRADLPRAYNGYSNTELDPLYDERTEDLHLLLRPLFSTSFLLDDFLAESWLPRVGVVVLSSASSKTAIALAHLLMQRGDADVIGLTSERSRQFAAGLGCYSDVVTYDEIGLLPQEDAVYVDMAGDAGVRERLHSHFGERLQHSAVVGATHHEGLGGVPDDLPGPRPTFFFAPEQFKRRVEEWGEAELQRRLASAWGPFVDWSATWLEVRRGSGAAELERAYLELLDGTVDPARGDVISPVGP